MKEIEEYSDIIDLPHHISSTRKQMSLYDRAAQFAPFAALTGHDALIEETAHSAAQELDCPSEWDEYTKDSVDDSI